MSADILTNRWLIFGKVLCYLVLFLNVCMLSILLFYKPSNYASALLLERHELNLFLFIITSSCLLSKYNNLKFFRIIGWYAGFIILLSCLLLFIESVIYSNFITAYFHITEKTSLLTTLNFFIIGISLLDLALVNITWRSIVAGFIVISLSLLAALFNLLNFTFITPMSLYTAVNFILLGICFTLLFKQNTPNEF